MFGKAGEEHERFVSISVKMLLQDCETRVINEVGIEKMWGRLEMCSGVIRR